MTFWQKIKNGLIRFMQGRHGADNLGMFTLLTGLACSLIGSFTGIGILSLLGMALYVITLFRMLSRNNEARAKENRKYIELSSNIRTKVSQFIRRCKNRKEYKYFRCPQCRTLLRVHRGGGKGTITCSRCKHQFVKKT